MQVCHAKFKPRDAAEVMFITNMVERVTELVKKHNLPITKIRFGRQVKAWGSTAVSDYHVYRYWDADETKEFWINGHECDMSEEGMRYLEWSLIKGCFRFLSEEEKNIQVTKEDVLAFALRNNYVNNKKLSECYKAYIYADNLLGTDYRSTAK